MLMGVILLFADFKRVFGVLLLNKNIDNYIIYPQLKKDDKQVITVAKWVMLILVSALFIFTSYPRYKKKYLAQKTAFYGVWEVIEFNRGNQKNNHRHRYTW